MTLPFDANPPLRLLVAYQQCWPDSTPEIVFCAPGRSLWLAGRLCAHDRWTLRAPDVSDTASASFTRQSARLRQTWLRRPLPRWARFPAGVLLTLADAEAPGLEAVVCGDEPPGPRYEYALMLLFVALLYELADRPYLPGDLSAAADAVLREFIDA